LHKFISERLRHHVSNVVIEGQPFLGFGDKVVDLRVREYGKDDVEDGGAGDGFGAVEEF
jgi:hypothetical protein